MNLIEEIQFLHQAAGAFGEHRDGKLWHECLGPIWWTYKPQASIDICVCSSGIESNFHGEKQTLILHAIKSVNTLTPLDALQQIKVKADHSAEIFIEIHLVSGRFNFRIPFGIYPQVLSLLQKQTRQNLKVDFKYVMAMRNNFKWVFDNFISVFELLTPQITARHEAAIQQGVISNRLQLVDWYCHFRAASFNSKSKKIIIHERFLVFAWAIIYYFFTIKHINWNDNYRSADGLLINDDDLTKRAENLLIWARQLLKNPNAALITPFSQPELIQAVNQEVESVINVTNDIFKGAIGFILWHEFAHGSLEHQRTKDRSVNKSMETEADTFARRILADYAQHDRPEMRLASALSVISAQLLLLFMTADLNDLAQDDTDHPDIDFRIINSLQESYDLNNGELEQVCEFASNGFFKFFQIYSYPPKFLKTEYATCQECIEDLMREADAIKANWRKMRGME
jgi:Peptidase U49